MYRGYSYRIYPNEEQKAIIEKTLGVARFVYNYGLDMIHKAYFEEGRRITYVQVSQKITELRETPGYEWLKEVSRDAITQALIDLNSAFINFFKYGKRYPKHKDEFIHKKDSYRVRLNISQDKENWVNIEKLSYVKGQRKFQLPENVCGRITIRKTATGKYFIGVKYQIPDIEFVHHENDYTNKSVGIDMGIKTFITLSTGEKIDSPLFYTKNRKRFNYREKAVWRKPILDGVKSKNHMKACFKRAKLYEKVANQRKDWIHKLTHRLTTEFSMITIEDFSASDMMNRARSSHIRTLLRDMSHGAFLRQLSYKSEQRGVKLIIADKYYPSTQICSSCGYQNKEASNIDVREWICPNCGSHHDRDINAAKNLLNYGLTMLS